jgi:hypothetical protein
MYHILEGFATGEHPSVDFGKKQGFVIAEAGCTGFIRW